MSTAYVVVTLIAIAVNASFAMLDFIRAKFVLNNMAKLGVPESWLPMLGGLKAAGVAGLLLGLSGVPLIGTAAALGLAVFFLGAIITHLRAGDASIGFAAGGLLLAMAVLGLDLAA